MTVHHECRVKREKSARCNQSDVYYQTSISTCFGHHYAHHQENKTVYCSMWCSVLVVLNVVVWSWDAGCVHCAQCTQQNLMVTPLEESISNIFSYEKKYISHDGSILCGSCVAEFCHRFSACVVQLQRCSLHRRTLSGTEPRGYMC